MKTNEKAKITRSFILLPYEIVALLYHLCSQGFLDGQIISGGDAAIAPPRFLS